MNYENVIENLRERGFLPHYSEDTESAVSYIKSIIPSGAVIGFGGSETVNQMNLLTELKEGYVLLHRNLFPKDDAKRVMAEMHTADWYVCSVNALTEGGELVNIDGRANRVVETLYGPENVLFIAGTNKLTPDLEKAIHRAKNIAAPANCKRLKKDTPCAETGICCDCGFPSTICRTTVILHYPTFGKNVHVLLINKNLGY